MEQDTNTILTLIWKELIQINENLAQPDVVIDTAEIFEDMTVGAMLDLRDFIAKEGATVIAHTAVGKANAIWEAAAKAETKRQTILNPAKWDQKDFWEKLNAKTETPDE